MTARWHDGRMARWTFALTAFLAVMPACQLAAQDVRARLEARGLPAELVQQIVMIAADASAQGLPTTPLADKAIEGYAKQVPSVRIVTAVRQFGSRMLDGRSAVVDAGVEAPSPDMVTAAAEALGRGFRAGDVGRVVRAAPRAELAAPGLTVAAALSAQGMATPRAVDVVTSALQGGRSASQMLDLPSVARAMQANGLSADEAGQQMLRGGPPPDGRGGPGGMPPAGGNAGPGRMGGQPGGGLPPPPPRDGRPPDGGHPGPGGGRPVRP